MWRRIRIKMRIRRRFEIREGEEMGMRMSVNGLGLKVRYMCGLAQLCASMDKRKQDTVRVEKRKEGKVE